jgi:hypothetical protein
MTRDSVSGPEPAASASGRAATASINEPAASA